MRVAARVACSTLADELALSALEHALAHARAAQDRRAAFVLLEEALRGLAGSEPEVPSASIVLVERALEDWLARMRSAGRSSSALTAYRQAVADFLGWARRSGYESSVFEEATVVAYLDAYRSERSPAPATYHRRFLVLRRFMRWVAQREGLRDPFAELDAPPKPRQQAAWLTREEFARLLDAAAHPTRRVAGIEVRDRLVLLTLVTTGLRRAELVALDWADVDLDATQPTLLVRRGKGSKPRRQPIPETLAGELRALRAEREAAAEDPVFTGLQGGRLQPTILAAVVRRAAERAGLDKHVTAHTLRHTAATWLRQASGDARLVAEYLGHADLSTVSRYTHVASDELRAGAETIAALASPAPPPAA